jgi:hypothetical protein
MNEIQVINNQEIESLSDLFSIREVERIFEKVHALSLTYVNGMTFEIEIKTYKLEDSEHHKTLFYVYIDEYSDFKSSYFIDWNNALNFAKKILLARSRGYTEFLKRKEARKRS